MKLMKCRLPIPQFYAIKMLFEKNKVNIKHK